jgi:hypothetical protein
MKRAFDVVSCALFLLLFWPVLLVIIVVIRLQSPGPAIFAQGSRWKGLPAVHLLQIPDDVFRHREPSDT